MLPFPKKRRNGQPNRWNKPLNDASSNRHATKRSDVAAKQENNAKRARTSFHLRNIDFLVSSFSKPSMTASRYHREASLFRLVILDLIPAEIFINRLARFSFRPVSFNYRLDKLDPFLFAPNGHVASSRSFNRPIKFFELAKSNGPRQIDRVKVHVKHTSNRSTLYDPRSSLSRLMSRAGDYGINSG